MSIEFARSYKTSDGVCHATVEMAQHHELRRIIEKAVDANGLVCVETATAALIKRRAEVVSILTTTESSRPRARGAKKPRKNRVTEPATTTAA